MTEPSTETFAEDIFVTGGSKANVPRNMSFVDYITTFTSVSYTHLTLPTKRIV